MNTKRKLGDMIDIRLSQLDVYSAVSQQDSLVDSARLQSYFREIRTHLTEPWQLSGTLKIQVQTVARRAIPSHCHRHVLFCPLDECNPLGHRVGRIGLSNLQQGCRGPEQRHLCTKAFHGLHW